jgi:methyl-accepting chemotaxis protein
MTTEERFERIEHVTAALIEERRKDREESRQLWRDTQRQINELAARTNDLALKLADANDAIARLADETQKNAQESRAADQRLGKRIGTLVSPIGQLLAKPA